MAHSSQPAAKAFTKTIISKTSYAHSVIPGLTRNPLAFKYKKWIPAFAGMTD
jgi:hypothetical protein